MTRSFKNSDGGGRYLADTPIQAAKKIAEKLFTNSKKKKLIISIKETTKNSSHKTYKYVAEKHLKNAKQNAKQYKISVYSYKKNKQNGAGLLSIIRQTIFRKKSDIPINRSKTSLLSKPATRYYTHKRGDDGIIQFDYDNEILLESSEINKIKHITNDFIVIDPFTKQENNDTFTKLNTMLLHLKYLEIATDKDYYNDIRHIIILKVINRTYITKYFDMLNENGLSQKKTCSQRIRNNEFEAKYDLSFTKYSLTFIPIQKQQIFYIHYHKREK